MQLIALILLDSKALGDHLLAAATVENGMRAANAIAYTQTTCSTGAMPAPRSLAARTMSKPCFRTLQALTPTQPHKPGNKNWTTAKSPSTASPPQEANR